MSETLLRVQALERQEEQEFKKALASIPQGQRLLDDFYAALDSIEAISRRLKETRDRNMLLRLIKGWERKQNINNAFPPKLAKECNDLIQRVDEWN